MTLALVLVLSLFVGVALGALGGGGSILTVPILVYVAGLEPKQAIATSMLVVGVTSAAGAITHARVRSIRWRTGILFGIGGMAGAFVGGLIAGHLPGRLLLAAFSLMMIATAAAMLRGPAPVAVARDIRVVRALLDGALVGLVTGLVGAGGGFLVVPALALIGGLSMPAAIGTSLVVIAMKSIAGLAGYLTTVTVPWDMALGVAAAAVLGSILGSRVTGWIPEHRLRPVFGWFVLVIGTFVLLEQTVPKTWLLPGIGVLAAAGMASICWRTRVGGASAIGAREQMRDSR